MAQGGLASDGWVGLYIFKPQTLLETIIGTIRKANCTSHMGYFLCYYEITLLTKIQLG